MGSPERYLLNIKIYPKIVFIRFLYLILLLLLANILGLLAKFNFDHDYFSGLILLFDFNIENNIPTLFSSLILILCSVLLAFIASTHKKKNSSYYPWAGLSLIFLFLSVDEIASIHERLGALFRTALNTSGLLYHAWVIPYGVILLVFIIVYFRFLMRQTKNIRNLFVVSGTTYVAGALGFELLGGWQNVLYGSNNITYSILYTCEEFLEMLGIVIFIYALLVYITKQFKTLKVSLIEEDQGNQPSF